MKIVYWDSLYFMLRGTINSPLYIWIAKKMFDIGDIYMLLSPSWLAPLVGESCELLEYNNGY